MIEVTATVVLVGLVSAFVPATPVEPYLLGAVALTGHGVVVAGTAAAAGQTAGKALLFLGARGAVRWQPLHRWIQRRRHITASAPDRGGGDDDDGRGGGDGVATVDGVGSVQRRTPGASRTGLRRRAAAVRATARRRGEQLATGLRRPLWAVPILSLSAVLGFPPLLLVTFYAAGTRMRAATFVLVCLAGRSARFVAVAAAPQLLGFAPA